MQVTQNIGIFNNQKSANITNETLFANALNDIEAYAYAKELDLQTKEQVGLNSEYNNLIKKPLATYIEVNSNAIFSMRNSMQNEITPIDIKRVNAVLAYSA